jgi:hypothetical protein
MLEYLKNEANKTYTENGAVTNRSSGKDCVDLFATIGAIRRQSDDDIVKRFMRAYTEDPDVAMKILFFARDVRGGLGERRVFRTILRHLAVYAPASVVRNLPYVAEYGRWDDLLVLLDTPCAAEALTVLRGQFDADMAALKSGGEVSLLGKWLPSVNASSGDTVRLAKRVARAFGMNDAAYRKAVTALRERIRIIENNLRQRDYTFDYGKQPSKAMLKYRRAFLRNDQERYLDFLSRVERGEAKLHADTLLPYEIVEPVLFQNGSWYNHCAMRPLSDGEKKALNATWSALPDYTDGENALAVVDTSGSMYCHSDPMPASVALSLGLYFAERNRGVFHNHFIEFSRTPQLIRVKGETFADRLAYIASFNEVANTDLKAVFELILDAAVKNGVPQEELPAKLYLISDMEFDACTEGADLSNFRYARQLFESHGYKLPQVIFWNVASRHRQQPVTVDDRGVALVSGCSPRVFSLVMEGEMDPYSCMMSVVGAERYAPIAA